MFEQLFYEGLFIIRYNMRREERQKMHLGEERNLESRISSEWECSQACESEEGLVSQQKIDDLHSSFERLREFARGLPEGAAEGVPACVEDYYDKMRDYGLENKEEVVLIAQRRLNKYHSIQARMLRNKKIKRNWNGEDISLLVWLVSQRLRIQGFNHFTEFQKEDWEFISSLVSGSSWQKCKFRWLSLRKVKLVTNKWSKLESQLLSHVRAQNSKIDWKSVAEKLYERNHSQSKVFRTAKQCRQHWNCFLNPNIQKGPWTIQEDRKLLEYVLELEGSKKWSQISKFMEGRTENALKNRFNLLMSRQKKVSGNITEKRLVKVCLNRLMLEEGQQEQMEEGQQDMELLPSLAMQAMPPSLTMQVVPPSFAMQAIPPSLVMQDLEAEDEEMAISSRPSSRQPIVPTVVQPVASQLGLESSFSGYYNYISSNMVMGPANQIYISFMMPNQFC